eukprot:1867940-Rhodomonas_salina.1
MCVHVCACVRPAAAAGGGVCLRVHRTRVCVHVCARVHVCVHACARPAAAAGAGAAPTAEAAASSAAPAPPHAQ